MLVHNLSVQFFRAGARELFFDVRGGVKIMRATFRGVHKSVLNDNKEKHSPIDLVSLAASIKTRGCVPENMSFQKESRVKIPCFTPLIPPVPAPLFEGPTIPKLRQRCEHWPVAMTVSTDSEYVMTSLG